MKTLVCLAALFLTTDFGQAQGPTESPVSIEARIQDSPIPKSPPGAPIDPGFAPGFARPDLFGRRYRPEDDYYNRRRPGDYYDRQQQDRYYNDYYERQKYQYRDNENPQPFDYQYSVDSPEHGTYHSKSEFGDEYGRVAGRYDALLPDGRLQTVEYTVEGDSGYVPKITYTPDANPPYTETARYYQDNRYYRDDQQYRDPRYRDSRYRDSRYRDYYQNRDYNNPQYYNNPQQYRDYYNRPQIRDNGQPLKK